MKQALHKALCIGGGLLLLIELGSCDLLYSGKNLFAGIDGPDVAALKSATGAPLSVSEEDRKYVPAGLDRVTTMGGGRTPTAATPEQ